MTLQVLVGIGTALLLNEKFLSRSYVRGLAVFPYVVPTVIGIVIFRWLLDSTYGSVNWIIRLLGLEPVNWLGISLAMFTLVLISTWIFAPFVTLSILARLQTISLDLYDAAKVDGASAFTRFRHITLPELRDVLLVVITLRVIWMFIKFDVPYLFFYTGGSGRYIQNLPVYAFEKTFRTLELGYGSTICAIIVLILLVYVLIFRPVLRKVGG